MLARDPQPSFYPGGNEEREKPVSKPRVKKKKVRRVKKKTRMLSKSTYVLFAITLLGIGLVLLSRYAKITSVRTEISQLEDKKESLFKEKINLEAELEGIKSSEMVTEEAIIKLGMNYPDEDQIAYVDVPEKTTRRNNHSDFKESLVKAIKAVQIFFRR